MAPEALFDFVVWAETPNYRQALTECEAFFQRLPVHLIVASPEPVQRSPWTWMKTQTLARMRVGDLAPLMRTSRALITTDPLSIPLSVSLKMWGAWEESPSTRLWLTAREQSFGSKLHNVLSRPTHHLKDPLSVFWGLDRELIAASHLRLTTQLQFLELASHLTDIRSLAVLPIKSSSPPPQPGLRHMARLWWESLYLQALLRTSETKP